MDVPRRSAARSRRFGLGSVMQAIRLVLAVAVLIGALYYLRDRAPEWILPALGMGLSLGVLVSWLLVLRPAKRSLKLLHDGEFDAFHVANDARIQRTRNPRRRAILELNRATAFFHAGETDRAVAAMLEVGPGRFRGTTESLYWINLLMMLCYADPERAAALRQERAEHLDPERHPRLAVPIAQLHRVYRLMVENSLEDEAEFREQMTSTSGLRQAFAHYHVARIHALRGETDEALAVHAAGRKLWPALRLPAPTGPATGSGAS